MTNSLKIASIEKGDYKLDQVEHLFKKLYEFMQKKGLLLQLADGGEKVWRKSIENRLEKNMKLIALLDGEQVVGFIFGSIKLAPNYLAGSFIGSIDGWYIDEKFRKGTASFRMIRALETWLISKNVESIELQVLLGNENVAQFWQNSGYTSELFQMRKVLR